MAVPGVLAPSADVSVQDLRVLAADGLITRVFGDVYADVSLPPSVSLRAGALAAIAQPGDVIGRESAVWVHTGEMDSPIMHVLVSEGMRQRRYRPDCCVHESRATGADVVTIAELRLTTLQRSIVDLCAADLDAIDDVLAITADFLDFAKLDDYLTARGRIPGRARIRAAVRKRL